MFTEAGMHGFVGPVKVHVVLAQFVSVGVKKLSSCRLVTDVFSLEEKQHTKKMDRILARRALVDVSPKRDFRRVELPRHQPFVAHSAMTRLIVGPACRVVNPFPGKNAGKGTQDY